MAPQEHAQPQFLTHFERLDVDRVRVIAVSCERIAQRVGHAAGHARAQIHSGGAEDCHHARRHVFAAVLADAFDHGQRAAIADGEAFSGAAGDVEFSGRRAVEHGVADEDVAAQGSFVSGGDCDRAAAQALADVIIGFAEQTEFHSRDQECAEALSGGADKFAGDDAGDSGRHYGGATLPR